MIWAKVSAIAKYINVGLTFEGREIPALEIGNGSRVVMFECGIHAREWISQAFGIWLPHHLLSDSSLAPLLAKFRFVVVPVLNVDGFVITHATDRGWRKNRSVRNDSKCIGVDLNRK